ncbi:MAG TPA: four helix bundle protein [Thermoleophilaceae bacterium]|nr:four helix bundle protein [Thermoleophilaceae bacterium]
MPSNFQQLIAYQRSVELAHELHTAVEYWPLLDRKTVGPQLIRSATSVGANIAEASGRWHERDRRQFLRIARGSLLETEHWVTYSERRGLLAHGTSTRVDEVARLLNGLIRKRAPMAGKTARVRDSAIPQFRNQQLKP